MTRQQLETFLFERTSLTLEGLSKEGKKTRKALSNSLPTEGEISPKILTWLMPILEKYGYKTEKL